MNKPVWIAAIVIAVMVSLSSMSWTSGDVKRIVRPSQVGELKMSFLPPEVFKTRQTGTWVEVDGRTPLQEIADEKLRDELGKLHSANIPDASQQFLRVIGSKRDDGQNDPHPRRVGSIQPSSAGISQHRHFLYYNEDAGRQGTTRPVHASSSTAVRWTQGSGDEKYKASRPRDVTSEPNVGVSSVAQPSYGTIGTEPPADGKQQEDFDDPRPTNMAVYLYVCIED